jgi:cell division ATPase FtsA
LTSFQTRTRSRYFALAVSTALTDCSLQVGQGVIVVDMGGGTVDLVSYRLAKIQPLQMEELCVGIGT